MSERIVTFKKTNSEETFVFNERLSRVKNKLLFRELLVNHPLNEDSLVLPVLENEEELIRIKVHVANVGSFYFDFKKSSLEEKREELFNKISELKNEENPNKKVKELIKIVDKYEPLYALFDDQDKNLFTYENFEEIYKLKTLKTPLLVFYHADLKKPKKIREPKVYVPKPEKVKESKEKKEGEPFFKRVWSSIVSFFKKIPSFFAWLWTKIVNGWYVFVSWFEWKSDYIFYFIFAMLYSFALLAGIVWTLNGDGLVAFFYSMTALFVVTCIYATYVQRKDTKDWKVTVQNELTPNLIIFAGLAGGTVASFFTSKSIIKIPEGVELDFLLALWITIGASAFMLILLNFTPFLIHWISEKRNSKKAAPEHKEQAKKEPAKPEQTAKTTRKTPVKKETNKK